MSDKTPHDFDNAPDDHPENGEYPSQSTDNGETQTVSTSQTANPLGLDGTADVMMPEIPFQYDANVYIEDRDPTPSRPTNPDKFTAMLKSNENIELPPKLEDRLSSKTLASSLPNTSSSNWRPESKLGVARLTYEIQKGAQLHIVEVNTWDKETKAKIYSRQIRYKALKDLLSQVVQQVRHELEQELSTDKDNVKQTHNKINEELELLETGTAFNLDARLDQVFPKSDWKDSVGKLLLNHTPDVPPPVDHLIINLTDLIITGESILTKLRGDTIFHNNVLKDNKPVNSTIIREGKTLPDQKGEIVSHGDRKLYWRSLDILFRTYVCRKSADHDHKKKYDSEYQTAHSFIEDWQDNTVEEQNVEPAAGENPDPDRGSGARATETDHEPLVAKHPVPSCIDFNLRLRPKLEEKTTTTLLHIDFDVVPHVRPGASLAKVVETYLSDQTMSTGLGYDLVTQQRIRQILCGLQVVVDYDIPDSEHIPPILTKAPRAQIKDIKAAKDIDVKIHHGDQVKSSDVGYFKSGQ